MGIATPILGDGATDRLGTGLRRTSRGKLRPVGGRCGPRG